MLPGLYSAASGLEVAIRNQEVVSHNLAHVNVPGFRRKVAAFESMQLQLAGENGTGSLSANTGASSETTYTDFAPGTYETTGRKLDVAIRGDGFLTVAGPDGPLYTRAGNLQLNGDGALVNKDGFAVLGTGGPIQFPPNVSSQRIEIAKDGQVRFDGVGVGQLQLTAFENNQQLIPYGTTLYAAGPNAVQSEAEVQVEQGVREMSNVSSMHELVQMIVGMRFYELSTKAMNSLSTAIQENTNLQQGG